LSTFLVVVIAIVLGPVDAVAAALSVKVENAGGVTVVEEKLAFTPAGADTCSETV